MSKLESFARCALVLALAAIATADVVHLKNGGRVEGRVTEDGDTVRVELSTGTLTFPLKSVDRIERKETHEERLRKAVLELGPEDSERALELVAEADAAGLTSLANTILRDAAKSAPDDAVLSEALERRRVLRDALPDEEGSVERLVSEFGKGATIVRTNHFIIVHDVSHQSARLRGDLLEMAWSKFHELAYVLQVEPKTIPSRREIMLFSDHDRWVRATGVSRDLLRGMSGLFVGKSGRVMLFDPSQSPQAREAGEKLETEIAALEKTRREVDAHEEELDLLEERLDAMTERTVDVLAKRQQLKQEIEAARTWVEEQRQKLDARAGQLRDFGQELRGWESRESLASTTHEACHQLAFATGVGRMGEPRWLTEGLATLFELDSKQDFVLEAPNRGRLRDVRRYWAQSIGGDLRRIVTGEMFNDPDVSASLVYAEAWSLAHYLTRRHADAFSRYVRESKLITARKGGVHERIAEFAEFFGDDIDSLERDWRRYVERL